MSIFFTPVIVKDMDKNLDITKPRYSEKNWLVPSLHRGSTEEASKIPELPLSLANWQKRHVINTDTKLVNITFVTLGLIIASTKFQIVQVLWLNFWFCCPFGTSKFVRFGCHSLCTGDCKRYESGTIKSLRRERRKSILGLLAKAVQKWRYENDIIYLEVLSC